MDIREAMRPFVIWIDSALRGWAIPRGRLWISIRSFIIDERCTLRTWQSKGLMGRTVEDVAMLLSVQGAYDDRVPK
ncbi:hypothetical protein [Mesorhizobium sp.]|uniref:hypothetical protein n=1 Tax=Mesorhizobium sp. TaxID=1871066 RepID=UPI000FE63895|nr:hypothetical protein [Mesorhizobium sp.]RWQ62051.1 MAG: hypothetical protein EOS86_32010 [Mesorhizobium sp.]